MSINELYKFLIDYGMFAAGAVIVLLMLNRYRKVAATGNVRRMTFETAAPGIMLVVAIAVTGAGVAYALPKVEGFLNSEQIQAAVEAGDIATQAVDSFLFNDVPPSGGFQTVQFGNGGGGFAPDLSGSQSAPAQNSLPQPTLEPTTAPAPYIAPAQNQVISYGNDGFYVVKRGDTLSKIAKAVYGDADLWPTICNANASILRGNCSNIMAGQRLTIPPKGTGDNRIVSGSTGNNAANRTQNGQAFTNEGQKYITALNNAAQPQPTATRKLILMSAPPPGTTPTPHEFATRP